MRIFVDANIIIATLNKEYPLFTWSSRVLSLQGKNNIELYTSTLCLAIAFYFASKKSGQKIARGKIEILCTNIGITPLDQIITFRAINNCKVNDFEDGLEYYSALSQNCDCIITENPEDFYFSKIDIYRCEDFIKLNKIK
jgi:predicted nucleic acid-binding protein